jgi:hypothetical protein
MNSSERNTLNRRDLLRQGGLALSLGALVAACGSGRGGGDAPGRIGIVVPTDEEPADLTVDDAVLLRTLQSLEYAVIELHTRLLDMGVLGDDTALAERFIDDHRRHADAIGGFVVMAGGEPFECANPFAMERAVEPVLAAIETSDDPTRDAYNTVSAFETLLGESYQALAARLEDRALRTDPSLIGGEEHRHAAYVAMQLNPDTLVHPDLSGEEAEEETTFPTPYAIEWTFGSLTGIDLTVGAPNEDDGSRFEIQLQTPGENTFVYNDLSC